MCSPVLDNPPPQAVFDCHATAALLRALRLLIWASHVGVLLAAGMGRVWPVLLCWLLVIYFAVRVEFDARLLELIAADPVSTPMQLDKWLASVGLRAGSKARTIEDRCIGARRLARNFFVVWALQMAAILAIAMRGKA